MPVLAGDLRSRPWATLWRSPSWPASLVSTSQTSFPILEPRFPPSTPTHSRISCFRRPGEDAVKTCHRMPLHLPRHASSPLTQPLNSTLSACSSFLSQSFSLHLIIFPYMLSLHALLLAVSTGFLMFDSFDFYDIWEPQSHCWDTCCLPTGKCTLEVCELHKADMGERDRHCRLAHSFGESKSFPTSSAFLHI